MSGSHVDLSLVPPDRRDEILRRIEAVRRYLRSPSRRAAVEGAAELGVGLVSFYNLAKAWRDAPRAENLAGSGQPRVRRSTMSAEQLAVVDEAVATSKNLDRERIVDRAYELAAAAGIDMPTRHIVRIRVDRTKPASIPATAMAAEADLVLDECVIDMPVAADGKIVRPLCSVLVDTRTLAPIGLHLTQGPPDATLAAATILDALKRDPVARRTHAEGPLLDLHVGDDPGWRSLLDILAAAGIRTAPRPLRARGSGQVIMNVLGATPGLRFKPRMLFDDDRSFDYRLKAKPLDISDAASVLRSRLGVGHARPSASLHGRGQEDSLTSALSSIVRRAFP